MTPEANLQPVRDGSENIVSQPAPVAAPEPPRDISDIIAQVRTDYANQPPPPQQPPQPVTPAATAPAMSPTPVAEPVAAPPPPVAPIEPAPVAEPEPVIPAPESRLAPIFELGNTDDAVRSAAEIINKLRYDDPIAAENLLNGVFFANEKTIQAWTLQRLGITPEKVGEFKEWVESGQALPVANALPPFPVPDADGMVVVDGCELNVKMGPDGRALYPTDKLAYENARKAYEFDVKEQTRANQERTAQENAKAEQQRQVEVFHDECFDGTSKVFLDERMGVVKSLLEPAIANLAPEDKIFGEMFEAFVEMKVVGSEEMFKVGQQAKEHLVAVVADTIARCQRAGYTPAQIKEQCNARLREGRMVDFAAREDKYLREQIQKYKVDFVNQIARRNRAEIAATATAPVIPEGIPQVVVATPPLDNDQPEGFQDILERARQQDRATAAQYSQ